MVSIIEDSRERYFDEGAMSVVSRIADSVLKASQIDGLPVSSVLDRSCFDDDLRREVEAEIERRRSNRGVIQQ